MSCPVRSSFRRAVHDAAAHPPPLRALPAPCVRFPPPLGRPTHASPASSLHPSLTPHRPPSLPNGRSVGRGAIMRPLRKKLTQAHGVNSAGPKLHRLQGQRLPPKAQGRAAAPPPEPLPGQLPAAFGHLPGQRAHGAHSPALRMQAAAPKGLRPKADSITLLGRHQDGAAGARYGTGGTQQGSRSSPCRLSGRARRRCRRRRPTSCGASMSWC